MICSRGRACVKEINQLYFSLAISTGHLRLDTAPIAYSFLCLCFMNIVVLEQYVTVGVLQERTGFI